jgi:hypothetical protein
MPAEFARYGVLPEVDEALRHEPGRFLPGVESE